MGGVNCCVQGGDDESRTLKVDNQAVRAEQLRKLQRGAQISLMPIEKAAARTQARTDSGGQAMGGVNCCVQGGDDESRTLKVDNQAVHTEQLRKLQRGAQISLMPIEKAAARTQACIDSGGQAMGGVNCCVQGGGDESRTLKVDNQAVRTEQLRKLQRGAQISLMPIEKAAARTQARIDSGGQAMGGVNCCVQGGDDESRTLKVDNQAVRAEQLRKLQRLLRPGRRRPRRRRRNPAAAGSAEPGLKPSPAPPRLRLRCRSPRPPEQSCNNNCRPLKAGAKGRS